MKFLLLTLCVVWLGVSQAAIKYCKPGERCWPSEGEIASLGLRLAAKKGRLMTPRDQDWVGKYLTFNQAVAKTPALVAFVLNVEQIRDVLKFAFKYNIKVSIVSSGHSFLGRDGADDSLQISVHYMKGIDVNLNCPENKNGQGCVTVQSGVQFGEVYKEVDKYNRIVMGGNNPTVSVSGWNVGGGHSSISRSFGLGVHNVLEFHLITADLSEVWARPNSTIILKEDGTKEESADTSLFYALRGGGGAFGVLIDMKMKLHPASKMVQLACQYPIFADGTSKSLKAMLLSMGDPYLNAPSTFGGYLLPVVGCDPETKKCGGSLTVSIVHYGGRVNSPDDEWFQKFEDIPHSWHEMGIEGGRCRENRYDSYYDYEMSVPNSTYTNAYIGGSLIQRNNLTEDLVNVLVNHMEKAFKEKRTLSFTAIWVGGAVTSLMANSDIPVHKGWTNAILSLSAGTAWDPAKVSDPSKLIASVQDVHKDLEPYSDGKYYNEAEAYRTPEQWKNDYWEANIYNRLMIIKRKYDPQNRFTCVQCVGADWVPGSADVFG